MVAVLSLMRRTQVVAMVVALSAIEGFAADESSPDETLSPLQVPFQSMTGEELFAKLLEHNRVRDIHLQQYSAARTYKVTNDKGKLYADSAGRISGT